MTALERCLDTGRTYVIAEMSANHAGELVNALEIVRAANAAGADCLKVQTYTADTITLNCDNDYFRIKGGLWDGYILYELYKEAELPWEWHAEIKAECDTLGMDFLSTPFDHTAVDFLESLEVNAYKIASFELVDIPLIEYTASKGKPMIISCGMGSPDEIQDAVDACLRQGNRKIVLLKCTSEYPANYADMNLVTIPDMRERFKVPVGFSDHSMGNLAAVVAVSLGALVVEKHFCLSRDIPNPDSAFSMEPDEFANMVDEIRKAEIIRGKAGYSLTDKEKDSLVFRRSLFAVRDIRQGEPFSTENIKSIRPSAGVQPKFYYNLLGRPASKVYTAGTPIASGELENG